MSKTPFLHLAVPDFVADTLEMSTQEVGAYWLLIMSLWQRKGYLPNDQAKLKRVARVGRDWPKVWATIECHFEVDGDRIFNPRILELATTVASQRAVNAQSGARGGRAKALRSKERDLANATETPPLKATQPEPEPYKEKIEAKASTKKPRRACSLPENWVPSEKNEQDATDRNFTSEEIRNEADRFRDYHTSKGTTFKDWDAGWRTWLGNARKFDGNSKVVGGAFPSRHGQGGGIAGEVARRRASGQDGG